MAREGFGSRRVTESLRAIAAYLDEGVLIAEGVKPGQVAVLNTQPTTTNLGPRLTDAVWASSNKHIIKLPPGTPVPLDVSASGKRLTDVQTFKLVATDIEFSASSISTSATSMIAKFNAIPTTPRVYDVWVIDKEGLTFLLPDVLGVEVQDPAAPAALPPVTHAAAGPGPLVPPVTHALPAPTVRLGAIDPPLVIPGEKVDMHIILLAGTPSDVDEFRIVDAHGHDVKASFHQVTSFSSAQSKKETTAVEKIVGPTGYVCLEVTVPHGIARGKYDLVVTAKSGSEDKLPFWVGQK